jgi:hypothetical protein
MTYEQAWIEWRRIWLIKALEHVLHRARDARPAVIPSASRKINVK